MLDEPGAMSILADGAATATVMANGKMQLTLTASYNHRSLEIFPSTPSRSVKGVSFPA